MAQHLQLLSAQFTLKIHPFKPFTFLSPPPLTSPEYPPTILEIYGLGIGNLSKTHQMHLSHLKSILTSSVLSPLKIINRFQNNCTLKVSSKLLQMLLPGKCFRSNHPISQLLKNPSLAAPTRRTLAQLRSGSSPVLNTYLNRIYPNVPQTAPTVLPLYTWELTTTYFQNRSKLN